ncbi:hypothetical protein ACFWN1_06690 [Streptomyces sp. NPDC058459]|uniref:hypothetical protein n=1 Tax=Streptomyces sp. NPDC058459 TaxID=3346508 RepID=UPI00365769AE
MQADEARGQIAAATPERERTGPRHAAPRKPLLNRLHVPAGKAIAMAAMPTAVLMGMGFTPTLAAARDQPSNAKLADEYKDCVAALGGDQAEDSAGPSPSASESENAKDDGAKGDKATDAKGAQDDKGAGSDSVKDGNASPPDSGSGDEAAPEPAPASSEPAAVTSAKPYAATESPSASAKDSGGGVLGSVGDAIGDVLTGAEKSPTPTPTPTATSTPTPTATSTPAPAPAPSESEAAPEPAPTASSSSAPAAPGDAGQGDAGRGGGRSAGKQGVGADEPSDEATQSPEASASASASATPSPSASASADPENCEKATDAVGGVDNKVLLPDDPWFLRASSLKLHQADYKGIVEVRTSSGRTKRVLKYVISGGSEIGDLHQTVTDKASGKTYHVQAGKGTTSTIKGGPTVMYTESISGKLLGLFPLTFTPDSPPPLNPPEILFTDVTVRQAGQFGGTLSIPHLHQYID